MNSLSQSQYRCVYLYPYDIILFVSNFSSELGQVDIFHSFYRFTLGYDSGIRNFFIALTYTFVLFFIIRISYSIVSLSLNNIGILDHILAILKKFQ